MANLTGKTIGQLALLTGITQDTLFAVEYSGLTFHIPYSGLSMGGGATPDLEAVLTQGNSTGGNVILSPDGLSELGILGGQAYIACSDGINTNNYVLVQPTSVNIFSTDLGNNDTCNIEQQATYILLQNSSTGGNQNNRIDVSQTEVKMQNNLNGTQIQQFYVDGDSFNASYEDGINTIYLEGGLNNGFIAGYTDGTYNNYIRAKFDLVDMVYDDGVATAYTFQVDANGFIPKKLPAYQDDAAAGIAGLPQGYMYQTDGTGASPLNVAGILMVKQ